jgi:hypothetical protein
MTQSGKHGKETALALIAAAAGAWVLSGAAASASHFDNGTIDDVDFGPTQATGGSDLDSNIAEFKIGIEGSGGNFGSDPYYDGSISSLSYGRFVYSFRSIDGSFSNSNEAGTKRALVEWLMTEPDSTRRSLSGASLQQKHDVILRVTLYTTGGTTTQGYTEVEDCGIKATASSPRDTEDLSSVRIALNCRRDVLENMGFTPDQIDCIEEALGTGRSMRYIWRDSD